MEDASPDAAAAATGGDSRSHFQIDLEARQVMVKQIFKTLRWHLPVSDEEGRSRLQKLAEGFELKFYKEATNKDSYKRKIAMLLIYVKNMYQNSHRQENGADDKGKAPMPESPGDEIIPPPQEFWDSTLYGPGNEDPTYEPGDDRATNLKKRKFDCSSSWAPLLGQPTFSVPVDDPSPFLEIPEESSSVPSWINQQQFQEWIDE